MHALARDEGGTVEVRHHLGDLVGIAVQARVTAVGRRRGLHTQQGSRGHLAARHAVNGVVDIDRHDVLAACGRVDRLCRADGRQVAVALVGEDQIAGIEPLHGRSYGQGASVGGLDPVDVDIIVCEYGAAHGRNAYGLFREAHLLDDLGDQFMYRTMTAAGAVVHDVVGNELRFRVNQVFVFDFNLCHSLYFLISFSLSAASTSSGANIIPP